MLKEHRKSLILYQLFDLKTHFPYLSLSFVSTDLLYLLLFYSSSIFDEPTYYNFQSACFLLLPLNLTLVNLCRNLTRVS